MWLLKDDIHICCCYWQHPGIIRGACLSRDWCSGWQSKEAERIQSLVMISLNFWFRVFLFCEPMNDLIIRVFPELAQVSYSQIRESEMKYFPRRSSSKLRSHQPSIVLIFTLLSCHFACNIYVCILCDHKVIIRSLKADTICMYIYR